jgi:hypothetical protein
MSFAAVKCDGRCSDSDDSQVCVAAGCHLLLKKNSLQPTFTTCKIFLSIPTFWEADIPNGPVNGKKSIYWKHLLDPGGRSL